MGVALSSGTATAHATETDAGVSSAGASDGSSSKGPSAHKSSSSHRAERAGASGSPTESSRSRTKPAAASSRATAGAGAATTAVKVISPAISGASRADSRGSTANTLAPMALVSTIMPRSSPEIAAKPALAATFDDRLAALVRNLQRTYFNISPTATPRQNSMTPDGMITGTVGATDLDSDPLAATLVTGPTKGTVVVNADGSFFYKPSQALSAAGGTDTFTVAVSETNSADHTHGLQGLLAGLVPAITFGAVKLDDGSTIQKSVTITVSQANSASTTVGNLVPYPSWYPRGASWESGPIRNTPLFDDFSGAAGTAPDPTLWLPDTQWQGGTQDYRTDPTHISLDGNGHLVITVTNTPGRTPTPYVSGHVQAATKWSMGYGLLEVSAKLPSSAPGLVPAIWTLGVPYPNSMEYDLVETVTGFGVDKVYTHYVPHNSAGTLEGAEAITTLTPDTASAYHTYWISREPNHIQMGVDDIVTMDLTPENIRNAPWAEFEYPMYLIMNVAVNQWGGNPTASTDFPASMYVDWVRYTPLTT